MSSSAESLGLASASQLARSNPVRFPGESAEYRKARTELLAEEIDLRRRIERVAEMRRRLPPISRSSTSPRGTGRRCWRSPP